MTRADIIGADALARALPHHTDILVVRRDGTAWTGLTRDLAIAPETP